MKLKIILSCTMGTTLEWAEFTYYGYLAVFFAQLFFPQFAPKTALLGSLLAFAMSYLIRPLGSLLFGWLGDTCGRRQALRLSLTLMGLAGLGMGVMPTYQQLGLAAPILLLLFRCLQGLAVSGEFTGSAVYLIESFPERPYFYSSLISAFAALGMFLGALFAYLVSLPQMPNWAWRVPFVLGSFCCILGYYIRYSLQETLVRPNSRVQYRSKTAPIIHLIKSYKLAFIKAFALAVFVGVYIYICNIWWVSFVIEQHYFAPDRAKMLAAIAQGFVVVLTPIIALIADWCGKPYSLYYGLVAAIVFMPVYFIASHHYPLFALLGYALINASITSVMFNYMFTLFARTICFTSIGLAWNIAVAVFAGTAPLVAQKLLNYTHHVIAPAAYIMLLAVLALLVLSVKTRVMSREV